MTDAATQPIRWWRALSFLDLYRDPIVAANTEASNFRLTDLGNGDETLGFYLALPPSGLNLAWLQSE